MQIQNLRFTLRLWNCQVGVTEAMRADLAQLGGVSGEREKPEHSALGHPCAKSDVVLMYALARAH